MHSSNNPAIPSIDLYPQKCIHIFTKRCARIFTAALFIRAPNRQLPKYPSMVECQNKLGVLCSNEDDCSTTTHSNVDEFHRLQVEQKKLPTDSCCRKYKSRLNLCLMGTLGSSEWK